MKTPERVTWVEYNEQLAGWMDEYTMRGQHVTCGSPITLTPCPLSIHHEEFPGCAGGGMVLYAMIPFCPTCEAVPGPGCLHLPYVPSPRIKRALDSKMSEAPPVTPDEPKKDGSDERPTDAS